MAPPKNKLLEGPILRSLLALAVPIVAANALQSVYQLIDAFWVGRLGFGRHGDGGAEWAAEFLGVALDR